MAQNHHATYEQTKQGQELNALNMQRNVLSILSFKQCTNLKGRNGMQKKRI